MATMALAAPLRALAAHFGGPLATSGGRHHHWWPRVLISFRRPVISEDRVVEERFVELPVKGIIEMCK
jgi:hypothetical protein